MDHPDFQNPSAVDSLVTGCIENELSEGGLPIPIYPNDCRITQLESWYVDHSSNKSTPFTITLDNNSETPGGIYTYSSNSFFPIDNQLLGNEGYAHNYHFTSAIPGQPLKPHMGALF